MSASALPQSLIDGLGQAVGLQNVVVDGQQLEVISRTCIPFRELPSAVVYPTSTEDVQKVMRLAQAHDVPVWPVSTGKNWGYGEKTAAYPGGITLVLERMNKILQVDETLGFAVIEPGVTYEQLNDHLKRVGSRLWADCAGSTKAASVVGNALEKGRGLTPYADHFGSLCGLNVVLSDGSLLETGGGPTGNNHTRHTYRWGVGPYLDGLFAQSNLGIVVSAGVWLMPAPEEFDFAAFEYTAAPDQFGAFIDDLRELIYRGALRAFPHVSNDYAMTCILSQYPKELLTPGRRSLSDEAMATWRKRNDVAEWTFGCGLYGSPEEVSYQRQSLKRVLGKYGLVRFVGKVVKTGWVGKLWLLLVRVANFMMGKSERLMQSMVPAINLYRGIPTDFFVRQVYVKNDAAKPDTDIDGPRDGRGLVWIGPMVPFTSKDVNGAIARAKEIFKKHDFDFFVEVMPISPRSVILLFGIFYDKASATESAAATAWHADLQEAMWALGYPPYRAATMTMPQTLDLNPAGKAVLASLKQALDPNNLIAPGRYGTPTRSSTTRSS